MGRSLLSRGAVSAVGGLALVVLSGCSSDRGATSEAADASAGPSAFTPPGLTSPLGNKPGTAAPSLPMRSMQPNFNAGPADLSRSVVQRGPRVEIAYPESSRPDAMARRAVPPVEEYDHEVMRLPHPPGIAPPSGVDPVLQSERPVVSMPGTLLNFLAQGNTNSPGTIIGTPPDTNGAVGPNHFVQTVNGGIAIWSKAGALIQASAFIKTLWTGYVGTNSGNGCSTREDGDPVVVYDQLADRWLISQFSLPHSGSAPNFQCVAVSKTGDPTTTGGYWLYDFKYNGLNDYGKFGIWPDAYYANFNIFNQSLPTQFVGDDFCAYDRTSMLAGKPATQQCFLQPFNPAGLQIFGALPISLDGSVTPPVGEPGFFLQFDYSAASPPYNMLDLWKLQVDFATPANTTLTGPTVLSVSNFTPTCNASGLSHCIPQPGNTTTLDGLDDRVMFRFNYRNFGTHESLLVNHSVVAGAGSGVRWYELRSPNGTPSVFQQGTYAPADTNWRWMASIAQDQAQDFALGFSATSTTMDPSIGWTGRLSTDAPGVMGQGETIIDTGTATESDDYPGPPPQHRGRWGDYSNMTVDPADDCTFWYTQELFHTNGGFSWDTQIATFKFPNCAANDFSIAVAPPSQNVKQGNAITYTVSTAIVAGSAETIVLNIQDLPTGVSAGFNPTSVTTGGSSTLTLTATPTAPLTASPDIFTVIGTAPSAVHAATAAVSVVACSPLTTCPGPDNCGTLSDGCGGTINCGTCTALDQCHNVGTCNGNVCTNPNKADGTACNDGNSCTQTDTCQAGVCSGTNPVTCTALDQCHVAGTCNPANGVCSNPNKADGSGCNDGNSCTQTDTCQAGTCTGGNPVTCTAQDQCHSVGTCNTSTGVCSNPNKANGTACNDGNGCTQTDACQAGVCTGANPVVCTASDQCHVAGTCNPASGVCSNPAAGDGTTCNDGNSCTQTDACQTGVCTGTNPVVCTASDQCHAVGTCNPANGTCSNPAKADGSSCNDANGCTQTDVCTAGVCSGSNPVTCTAKDQCHVAGTCDPASGACSNPNKADGTTCNDNSSCTQNDACQAGVCTGATTVTCTAQDECHVVGTCDPSSGVCSNPNKTDGTACSIGTCQAGTCTAGASDAGTGADTGTGADSGSGQDSGVLPDGATAGDSGANGDAQGDGSTGTTGGGGGCSCRAAGSPSSPLSAPLGGMGALAMVGVMRLRRRRRSELSGGPSSG